MEMVVVLPAPLPPSSAAVEPRLEGEADAVDGGDVAIDLGQLAHGDRRRPRRCCRGIGFLHRMCFGAVVTHGVRACSSRFVRIMATPAAVLELELWRPCRTRVKRRCPCHARPHWLKQPAKAGCGCRPSCACAGSAWSASCVTVVVVYLVLGFDAADRHLPGASSRCRPGSTSSCASAIRRAQRLRAARLVLLAYDILQLAGLLYLTGGDRESVHVPAGRAGDGLGGDAAAAQTPSRSARSPSPPPRCCRLPPRRCPGSTSQALAAATLYELGVLASVLSGMLFLALYVLARSPRRRGRWPTRWPPPRWCWRASSSCIALDGLAAAAAHELGTPLSTIAVVAKELARELPPTPHRRGHRAAAGAGRALPRDPAQADAGRRRAAGLSCTRASAHAS